MVKDVTKLGWIISDYVVFIDFYRCSKNEEAIKKILNAKISNPKKIDDKGKITEGLVYVFDFESQLFFDDSPNRYDLGISILKNDCIKINDIYCCFFDFDKYNEVRK